MIFAISDLHLPARIQVKKFQFPPNYIDQVYENLEKFDPEILLIAGDFSYEHNFNRGINILEQVRHFPGKQKIFIEGNHDTFCHQNDFRRSLQMMYSSPEFYYVSGRATIIDDNAPSSHSRDSQGAIGLCGAMGWAYNEKMNDQRDFIMLQKQLEFLDESLTQLERLREEQYTETNICLLHYPPTYRIFTDGRMSNESLFHKILDYKFIDKIVYGHLHKETEFKVYTKVKNVELYCAVIDQLGFQPIRIK